jgi:hypothetical protein
MLWIIGVMLLSGIVGGIAGHITSNGSKNEDDRDYVNVTKWTSDVLTGIVASFCVPVFLQITQSKLMDKLHDDIEKDSELYYNLLYLAGFCLIAAFSSRSFIRSVSMQFLKQEVDEIKNDQREMKDDIAEIDPANMKPSGISVESAKGNENEEKVQNKLSNHEGDAKCSTTEISGKISDDDKKVISSLNSDRYARRSITGIARDAGLRLTSARKSLARLKEIGAISEGKSERTGSILYQLTSLGSKLL